MAGKYLVLDTDTGQIVGEVRSQALADDVHGAASKATPVDADTIPVVDSEASHGLKKWSIASLKAWVATYIASATMTFTNKTLTETVLEDQTVAGDYARTAATLHLKGGSGGTPILQMSRGSGETASHAFDFAIAGGGFSIRNVGSYAVALNAFAATDSELYVGQKGSISDQSSRDGLVSAGTHSPSAGADIGGGNLYLQAGAGTGAGAPGDLVFRTADAEASGTAAQSYSTRMVIDGDTGNVSINSPGNDSGSAVTCGGTQTLSDKTLDNSNTIAVADDQLTIESSGGGGAGIEFDLDSLWAGAPTTYVAPGGEDYYYTLNVSTAAAPSSSSADGMRGMFFADDDYLYVANGYSSWKRVALSSF